MTPVRRPKRATVCRVGRQPQGNGHTEDHGSGWATAVFATELQTKGAIENVTFFLSDRGDWRPQDYAFLVFILVLILVFWGAVAWVALYATRVLHCMGMGRIGLMGLMGLMGEQRLHAL